MKKLFNSIVLLLLIGVFSSVSVFTSCSKATASTSTTTLQGKVLLEQAGSFYTMNNDGTSYQKLSLTGLPSGESLSTDNSGTDGSNIYFMAYTQTNQRKLYKVSINGGSVSLVKDFGAVSEPKLRGLY